MAKTNLTAQRLRELFSYDQNTGLFLRKTSAGRHGRFSAGSVAGGVEGNGYIQIRIDAGRYPAHRLAWLYMTGAWPANHIDHIDGNRQNNIFSNLRDVPPRINAQNVRLPNKNNASGYLGVCWHKGSGKWVAQTWINRKLTCLGYFHDPAEAHAVYLSAKRKYHEGCTI